MSLALAHKVQILQDRAACLRRARDFFHARGVIEVDCPLITQKASVDAHIDLIPAIYLGKEIRYLHSSPEYGMKRLLTDGMGDCYQLAHVFRDGEYSLKHNPEFMMAEWYRLGMPFESFIEETIDFIRLFLGAIPSKTISYREAFETYLNVNPFQATEKDLLALLDAHGIPWYPSAADEGKDALLNLLLGTLIEPKLGREELTVLAYYPSTQAALAKTTVLNGDLVASRFEVYYRGIELCNGYNELQDAKEQRKRLEESNQHRTLLGKASLPIDEAFLQALEKGFPLCCGVAVGFDRLMLLRHKAKSLAEVLPFDWSTA
jgi:elongation factor P--(R)-beta-lysine ligase